MMGRLATPLTIIAIAGAVGWFFAGTLSARDVMTPECRARTDGLAREKAKLVKSAADYAFLETAERNIANDCGARRLWGRL